MKHLFTLSLILLAACSSSNSKSEDSKEQTENASIIKHSNFPKSQTILESFKHNYQSISYPDDGQYYSLSMTKKLDGYYLQININNDGQTKMVEELVYWKDEVFHDLNQSDRFVFNEKSGPRVYTANLSNENDFRSGYFDIYPQYGYDGWYYDVIDLLKDNSELSDTLLYAYARALDTKVQNEFTCGQFGYSDGKNCYDLLSKHGQNALTDDLLKRFIEEKSEVEAAFKKLVKQNPDFQTIVGSIGVKTSNTIMDQYLVLDYYQNQETAMAHFEGCDYPEFLLSHARNMLMSCPKDAVLFTFGDNDTYPVLYEQVKNGYRTDVRVVNLSLANVPRYISRLRTPHLDAPGIELNVPKRIYEDDKYSVIGFAEDNVQSSSINTNELAEEIRQTDSAPNNPEFGIFRSRFFKCDKTDDKKMLWKYTDNYMYKSVMMVYDAIASNPERAFVFSPGGTKSMAMGLQDYIQQEGMLNVLKTEEAPSSSFLFTNNTDVSYTRFTEDYELNPLLASSAENRLKYHYAYSLAFLADQLMEDNKLDSAQNMADLKLAFVKEPKDLHITDHMFVPIYFENDNTEKALELSTKLMSKFELLIEEYLQKPTNEGYSYLRSTVSTAFNLRQTLLDNDESTLANELKETIQSWEKSIQAYLENDDKLLIEFEQMMNHFTRGEN